VANVFAYARDGDVSARVGQVERGRVASIGGAGVLIIAEVSGEVDVFAASLGVAGVYGAGILVIAEGSELRCVDAFGSLVLGSIGPIAFIVSASVVVVTITINGTSGRRAL
jgi:hypothetical protein